jgi:hypothetical protein
MNESIGHQAKPSHRDPRARLTIVPLSLRKANEVVGAWHRHHVPARGCKFCIGVQDEAGRLCGVAIAGRPVARLLDDGTTLEVNRVATDGTANACSALYGACRRIAREMGYRRVLTYTLPSEGGASLRGAGWKNMGEAGGRSWDKPSRRRTDKAPTCVKTRWEVTL